MAYRGPRLTELHGAQRDARIKQLLSSPGTRHLVPTKDLPSDLRAKRALNQRLAQPIVPGSRMTNRDLAHQREAAVDLEFGPRAVDAYQQRERETGGWYDQYLRELDTHARNVQGFGQAAQDQIANLDKIQGPADTAPQDPQNQAIAQQAQAVRSALLGALKAKVSGQATAANTYADTLAHVVAPGQKVQALTAARGNTDALRQKVGAFRTDYEARARGAEGKNVIATQALIGDIAHQTTQDQVAGARIGETARHNRAAERNAAANAKSSGYGPGRPGMNKYGYTHDEWSALSARQRDKARSGSGTQKSPASRDADAFYDKYGARPASTAAVGNAQNSIEGAAALVRELKAGGNDRNAVANILLKGEPVQTVGSDGKPIVKNGKEVTKRYPRQKALWLTVALDLAYLGGRISAGTASKLHKAGYTVKVLGLSTGAPPVSGPKDLPSGGPTNPK